MRLTIYAGIPRVSSYVLSVFPCLTEDNSFYSSPATGPYGYNCYAWAAGQYSWVNFYTLSDFDDYYARAGYTRTGADADNGAIALWMNNGTFSHASVRKNSTIPYPHGFEWESKCGSSERVMHTRDALTGYVYGSIVYYYKPVNGVVNYSPPINETDNNVSTWIFTSPQSVITPDFGEESRFTQSELNQIAALKDLLPDYIKSGFNVKYSKWEETWTRPELYIHSNIRFYAASVEYYDLLDYCEKYGKAILPLIFDRLNTVFASNLLIDLSFSEYKKIFDDLKSDFISKPAIPIPSTLAEWVIYSITLLEREYENILQAIQDILKEENT